MSVKGTLIPDAVGVVLAGIAHVVVKILAGKISFFINGQQRGPSPCAAGKTKLEMMKLCERKGVAARTVFRKCRFAI